jgi:hypothetical protein
MAIHVIRTPVVRATVCLHRKAWRQNKNKNKNLKKKLSINILLCTNIILFQCLFAAQRMAYVLIVKMHNPVCHHELTHVRNANAYINNTLITPTHPSPLPPFFIQTTEPCVVHKWCWVLYALAYTCIGKNAHAVDKHCYCYVYLLCLPVFWTSVF